MELERLMGSVALVVADPVRSPSLMDCLRLMLSCCLIFFFWALELKSIPTMKSSPLLNRGTPIGREGLSREIRFKRDLKKLFFSFTLEAELTLGLEGIPDVLEPRVGMVFRVSVWMIR